MVLDTISKLDPMQPRNLRYRNHYKIYILAFIILSFMVLSFWAIQFAEGSFKNVISTYTYELVLSGAYFAVSGIFYFFWLRLKLSHSVQVFNDHILIHNGRVKTEVQYADIESVNIVCWSIFYVKMKNGLKHYFNSSLERVDYIWEGIYHSRPELMDPKEFEEFRIKLVQYDHHQKRKEWFFKHKMVDIFNWAILPLMFIFLTYMYQSNQVVLHQQGLYFFRLFMYAMLVLLATAFFFTMVLKKAVFDKKISSQIENSDEKVRDLEFEGVVLQRSKIFQLITASFVFTLLVRFDINLFSVSKVKEDLAYFNLKKGHTILVDNRYNCISCPHQLKDGDLVVFGRGVIGQVLAKEGDVVGQVNEDPQGRTIASENVQEVPRNHVAIKAANGKDIVFVKIEDLVGRIQK